MPSATVIVGTGLDDDDVVKDAATYAGVPAATRAYDSFGGGVYLQRSVISGGTVFRVGCGLLIFRPTLSIDVVVTGATLRLHSLAAASPDSLSFCADYWIRDGTASDWSYTPIATALAPVLISSISGSGFNNYELLSAPANVPPNGAVGIRLHVTQRASDAAPTGDNVFGVANGDFGGADAAQLVIAYDLPGYIQLGTAG